MVDRDGLKETGIYRVCCITSDLQRLRHQFDRNYHGGEEMLAEKNVHVAANLLKLFFRELPQPLFTSTYYKEFLHAIQLTDTDNQRATLVKIIESLNSDNRRILFYLLDHLIRVSQYSDMNMMHLDNLAVVFGPILMRSSKLVMVNVFSGSNQCLNAIGNNGQTDLDQMSSELQDSMHQCQVVLACLKLRHDGILK
jgi:breakpoint cluster region protein